MDWNDWRDFLAIARHRTLSAAAAAAGVQQSTMGRRLKSLESRLGAKLLQRTPSGFVLTAAGSTILENVERIESETLAIERAITGKDSKLEGPVRLTATEGLTVDVLTPILAAFSAQYPGITLELIADPRHLNLAKGEADIALRMTRFTQNDLAMRKVAAFGFAAYASSAYLDACGVPDFARGMPGHRVVLPKEQMSDSPQSAWLAQITAASRVALRANSYYMLVAAAEAGMGVACLPRFLGDTARLTRLEAPTSPPVSELWLGIHRDIRDVPRFRTIAAFLAAGLRRQAPKLNPPS